jgi:penicillin amidase
MTLPAWYEPAQGYVVSANDRPQTDIVIGRFFSSADRVQRISSLIKQAKTIDRDMLARLQQDVDSESARELARTFVAAARDGGVPLSPSVARIVTLLEQWDGRYDAESVGAAALELVLYHFAQSFYSPQTLTAYASSWAMGELIRGDIAAAKVADIAPKVRKAAARCGRTLRGRKWGDLHRLRLQHPLGAIPAGGRHYRFFDLPASGSSHTVMKTASGLVRGRHGARFGANARYISDMSDLDANYFCLLGGQDGWFGSTLFADHVSHWRQGTHIQVPLRPESVKEAFPFVTRLVPEQEAEDSEPIRASAG